MSDVKTIRGAGGGGSSKARTPIEAPDSLHSIAFARILDLVSEGEVVGLVNGLQSVYLDETPVANADGSLNFKNVQIDTRNGSQNQTYIKGYPAVENEIAAGVELIFGTPWTRAITNINLSAVRVRLSVPALSKANTSNGDINGYTVQYAIDLATDGGAFIEKLVTSFTGKTSTKYERGHRIDLPDATTGWTIRVRRLTPQADSTAVADRTYVEAFTEIIDGKFRYPNSALVAVTVDAEQFQSIPRRSYHMKGRIIRVPANYDPVARTYTGIWDGTFKPAYSNNPAWVYFDLATNDRYGLGHLVSDAQLDIWKLYTIGQYCDGMVDDGRGGLEPRFTCNLYMQVEADAYRVMQDLATVFRGITYWGGGMINAVADKPEDMVYVYNQSNVIDGRFTYQGSARKTRFNVALVSWNDMNDFGRAKVEYIPDEEGIVRNGILQTSVIAIGCTSQGQAMRVGRHILISSRYETQSVTFTVGIDGTLCAPGQIIGVADKHRAGKRIGGRLSSGTINSVVLDAVTDVVPGDTITCILPSGVAEKRTVATVVDRTVTPTVAFTAAPVAHSVWMVESTTLNAQRFRVISVSENEGLTFTVTALQHNESKFSAIENGTPIDVPVITELPSTVQLPPTGIVVTHRFVVDYARVSTIVTCDWLPVAGAVTYEVGYRMNSGGWTNIPDIQDSIVDIPNVLAGLIEIRVNAVNASGKRSVPVLAAPYQVPEAPARSELPAIDLTIVGGVVTIDCAYDYFRLRLTQNVTEVRFVNVPSVKTIILEITQTGAFTIAMPASVSPVSGVPYAVSQTVGALDVLGLSTTNKGVLWNLLAKQPEAPAGGGTVFAASITPTTVSNTVATDGTTATAPSASVTASTAGGTAPITHAWTRADTNGGADFTVVNGNTVTPTFTIPAGTTAYPITTQTWRYTGTDAGALKASATANITLERTAPAGGALSNFDGASVTKFAHAFSPSTATAVAGVTFNRDGTWRTYTESPTTVAQSNDWISGKTGTSGDAYNIRYTVTRTGTGTGGSMSNGAAVFSPLNQARTARLEAVAYSNSFVEGSFTVFAEIQEIATGVIVASGTITLTVYAESGQ